VPKDSDGTAAMWAPLPAPLERQHPATR
jgi:hypothetical protein